MAGTPHFTLRTIPGPAQAVLRSMPPAFLSMPLASEKPGVWCGDASCAPLRRLWPANIAVAELCFAAEPPFWYQLQQPFCPVM
jgi:hypothetical protein